MKTGEIVKRYEAAKASFNAEMKDYKKVIKAYDKAMAECEKLAARLVKIDMQINDPRRGVGILR